MMMLKCLSQGSIGNSYILQYNDEMLLLDAGIGIKEIKRGLDYNLMGVQGVLITHSHL